MESRDGEAGFPQNTSEQGPDGQSEGDRLRSAGRRLQAEGRASAKLCGGLVRGVMETQPSATAAGAEPVRRERRHVLQIPADLC